MSVGANAYLLAVRKFEDHRPLLKFWDQTFGSPTLIYEDAVKLCQCYGFKDGECVSFDELRICLEIVRGLFAKQSTIMDVDLRCQGPLLRFLGFSGLKNVHSEAAIKKFTLAFSSYDEIMSMQFSNGDLAAVWGKDVLRLFQATLGINLLDAKVPKVTHLGYLAYAQRVIRGEDFTDQLGGSRVGDNFPIEATNQVAGDVNHSRSVVGWTLYVPEAGADFYRVASKELLSLLAFLIGCGDDGKDWPLSVVLEYVSNEDFQWNEGMQSSYLGYSHLRLLEEVDLLMLLKMFRYTSLVSCALDALTILTSIGVSGAVQLVREEKTESPNPDDVRPAGVPSLEEQLGSGVESSVPKNSGRSLTTYVVFPGQEMKSTLHPTTERFGISGKIDCPILIQPHTVPTEVMPGLTLLAREQPSRAKGDRTLKALMISDVYIRVTSMDPKKVLSTVMSDVFSSLVIHTGIYTQLALLEVTQILQSVNFASYPLAIPLTMSSRHDISQALTTAKLFVGWKSEEVFPELRALRYDYRSNDPLLVSRVLWTIFRIRYSYFDFYPEIWNALVKFASRCEKIVRDMFHWTQPLIDFMIKKALRDLEIVDDRVGLAIPSALLAPSPDAIHLSPLLDRNEYCTAIDLLPDMLAPEALYMHQKFLIDAQALYFSGRAVRYVVHMDDIPLFKVGTVAYGNSRFDIKGGGLAKIISTSSIQLLSSPTGGNRKRRKSAVSLPIGAPVLAGPGPVPALPAPAVKMIRNKPCHQWLSTDGCTNGNACRFDHSAPSCKST